MPRSPLITQAITRLSQHFGATTTSEYIAKSRLIASAQSANDPTGKSDVTSKLGAYSSILNAGGTDVSVGIKFEDELAELLFGSRGISYFNQNISYLVSGKNIPNDSSRANQVKIYGIEESDLAGAPGIFMSGSILGQGIFSEANKRPNRNVLDPTRSLPNLYAVNVDNPFLGPATRDVGALQIFLNGIPNIEFSKCVPYVDIDIITPRSALAPDGKRVGEGITLLKFLNPSSPSAVDLGILSAQNTSVVTEAGAVTQGGVPLIGAKSSMEMFTTPATLTNISGYGKEFVPVIDRFRPPMSLGQLQVSNKLRPAGGGLSFATARLEIVIHDRSRLCDFVDFVRPDLYGLTFMDITYGWSHIDGGVASNNAYGTLLDALKVKQRYRIINSSYTFDEVGQVKVSLSLATVGSTDLLFLRMRGNTSVYNQLEKLARQLSDILQEYQKLPKTPSLSKIDTITQFTDPNSILSAADDQGLLKQISEALTSGAVPATARTILSAAYGNITRKGDDNLYEVGQESLVAQYKNSMKTEYSTLISKIPTLDKDPLASGMFTPPNSRFQKMTDALGNGNYSPGSLFTESQIKLEGSLANMGSNLSVDDTIKIINDKKNPDDFISLGSIFYNIIGAQLAKSQIYDEIQLIFYPFNKYAGAVNSLPVSCFPIEKQLFNTAIATTAGRVQDLSLRDVIAIVNDRFVSFPADRAYLMSNFYNAEKAQKGEAEFQKLSVSIDKATVNSQISKIDAQIAAKNKSREDAVKKNSAPKIIAGLESDIAELTAAKSSLSIIKSNNYKIEPNYESTREERLKSVGITTGKFVQPNIQIEVEACPMLDDKNNEIPGKTMIKIHVYDAAQDPFSTLGEILAATRDDQLNVIRAPTSEFNMKAASPGGVDDSAKSKQENEYFQAGVAAGILEPREINDKPYYIVKGDYEQIKQNVAAGMPYIIYGSQNSAITTANLQSNNNAGLANVMIQRAFNAAGDYDPAAVDAGVPMQIVPSQLSLSTVGCPLFFPMQRLFVDFGTGTTADNVYSVIQIDHTIGNDGFKTEVKMNYGQGFATYTSLAQNLAAALAVIRGNTTTDQNAVQPSADIGRSPTEAQQDAQAREKREPGQLVAAARESLLKLKRAATAQQELEAQAKLKAQLAVDSAKAAAAREVQAVTNAVVDPAVQQSAAKTANDAREAADQATATANAAREYADNLTQLQSDIDALKTSYPDLAERFLTQEALPALGA